MDDELLRPDNRTKGEVRLHRLRERLAQSHWNFSLTYNSFDGFSEGVCLLGGVDPIESEETKDQYGPDFLPGSLAMYWAGPYPSWADAWQLRYSVDEGLRRYAALGLKGRVPVRTALLAADKAGLTIPWLEAASNDLECARRLPPRLRTNEDIRDEIRLQHSTSAGRSRGHKAAKTQFLRRYAKPVFDRMAAKGFKKEFCAESTGRPIATRIAGEIYHKVLRDKEATTFLADNVDALPALTAFEDNVVLWLKEREKSSQQKKQ